MASSNMAEKLSTIHGKPCNATVTRRLRAYRTIIAAESMPAVITDMFFLIHPVRNRMFLPSSEHVPSVGYDLPYTLKIIGAPFSYFVDSE